MPDGTIMDGPTHGPGQECVKWVETNVDRLIVDNALNPTDSTKNTTKVSEYQKAIIDAIKNGKIHKKFRNAPSLKENREKKSVISNFRDRKDKHKIALRRRNSRRK